MNIYRLLAQVSIDPSELDIPKNTPTSNTVSTALELVFGILGGISLIIIVYAGLKFILSRGNAESATKARNTIIYAVIGLVISMLAFSIVRWVANGVSG